MSALARILDAPERVPLRVSVPVLLLLFPALLGGFLYRRDLQAAEARVEHDVEDALHETARATQRRLEAFGQRGDLDSLRDELAALGVDPELRLALVARSDGQVLAATRLALLDLPLEAALAEAGLPAPASLEAELEQVRVLGEATLRLSPDRTEAIAIAPLQLDGKVAAGVSSAGMLLLVRSLAQPKLHAARLARLGLVKLLALLAAFAGFGWLWLHRALTRRVGWLVAVAGRFASGDRAARAGFTGRDELSRIGAAFDAMAARVDESQKQVRMHDRLATVGTLASGVAHEINNPLAYALSNLEFAAQALSGKNDFDRAEVSAAVCDALDGAQRVKRIVADMKTLSRGENETLLPVDLAAVADAMLNIAAHEIRSRARVVRAFGAAPLALGDAGRLSQIALNLLVNAAQAIPRGAAERNEIRVSTGTDAAGAPWLEVSDTGSGIPPEVLPRIFDAFFTTKPPGEGTGLGLSICQSLLAAMGGRIEVQSELGKGTRFRVTLKASPLAAKSAPAAAA